MKNYFDEQDNNLKWTILEKKTLLSTKVFDLTSQKSQASNGLIGDYIVLDTKDWVIIIPEIKDSFLMVKQYRHGKDSLSIEFPGGVIDKDEKPEIAALRELKEETGMVPKKLTKLACFNPNPALFNNNVHIYLAEELIKESCQNLDCDEFINTIKIKKQEVFQNLCKEPFCHGVMASAMLCYLQNQKIKI